MRAIWLSTLYNLNKLSAAGPIDIKTHFPVLPSLESKEDIVIKIDDLQKIWLDTLCNNIQYPLCGTCQQPLCGKQAVCGCAHSFNYQQEYLTLNNEIDAVEHALLELENSPFRQSRNAYSFSSGIFGGINFLLAHVACSAAVAGTSLIAPALLVGGYVYWRGKREEEKINADLQAEWMDKRISMLCKHREIVQLRFEKRVPPPQDALFSLGIIPHAIIKPHKEKRSLFGNPLSHFIVPLLSATSITYSVMKIGILSVAMLGGPIAWR
jgi:hypothetical protein